MWRMSVLSKVRPRDSLMLHISNCSLQNMSLTSDELQYREREHEAEQSTGRETEKYKASFWLCENHPAVY